MATNLIQKEEENDGPRINGVAQKYLADLNEERERLGSEFPLCSLLIDEAFERVYCTGRIPGREYLADVYKQKPMKITQRVFVPTKQYPKFNFTGKLLGPKGNSLRRLHEETQCKIIIKGRNSMRDRTKEEELRQSDDPRYAHLNKDLFIEISTVATPAEGYARIAYALAEIRKYLVPDKNDEVSQEQLRELMEIDPKSAKQYSKTVLNKTSAGDGASKFLSLIKQHGFPQQISHMDDSDEEIAEYQTRILKRPVASPYEDIAEYQTRVLKREVGSPYMKVPIKRPPATFIGTGFKRTREVPVKSHKPILQGIIKKYK